MVSSWFSACTLKRCRACCGLIFFGDRRTDGLVWAVSILGLRPPLPCLPWPLWRHHASELLRDRTRSLKLHTSCCWNELLPCSATERGAHVNSFLCDKTRRLSVQAFAVMKCCRDTAVKTRGSFCVSGSLGLKLIVSAWVSTLCPTRFHWIAAFS